LVAAKGNYIWGVSLFNDSMTPENMAPAKLKDDSRWFLNYPNPHPNPNTYPNPN